MDAPPELNPAQQEVLDQLGASREERPRFDKVLRHELRRALEDGLEPLLDALSDTDDVFISKHRLGQVMACERRFLAEDDHDFTWSVPLARGTIAHKAIELSVHWRREPEPLVLVDESISRLSEGIDGLADWLQTCSEVERAELRAEANDRVVKFLECWPPLKTAWRPVTESRLRLEIHDRFAGVIKSYLDAAVANGDIPPTDTQIVAYAWMGAINEVVIRWVHTGQPEPERLLVPLRTMLLRSVGVPEQRIIRLEETE